jgi:segregation and condensation protein A
VTQAYEVALDVFEGPLDLLLHLIKKHELDIFDIPIAFITEKYLAYLETLRALNLDVAGEYLLMAATLAYIKSRELLPPSPDAEADAEEAEEMGDPREQLIKRLLEYQKYRDAGQALGERPVMGRNVWGKGQPPEKLAAGAAPLAEVSVFQLIEALGGVLDRAKIKLTHDVVVDRISIADRIGQLVDRLEQEGAFTFESCFLDAATEAEPAQVTRHHLVITFLAILEMTRLKMIRLHQPESSASIFITRAATDLTSALEGLRSEEYSE